MLQQILQSRIRRLRFVLDLLVSIQFLQQLNYNFSITESVQEILDINGIGQSAKHIHVILMI